MLLFYYSQPQLTNEERNNLMKKVTQLISLESLFGPMGIDEEDDDRTITYEVSKIKNIIQNNKFPSSYNYIEDQKISPIIKDQGSCGSCWSFSSSSALAYRFYKKGIKVNLSPQYPLSCYLRDCDNGDYIIDAQFNLVKNGTVEEECMPYSSKSGKNSDIEQCPTKCKDGSDFKKYYSKNAYTTNFHYKQENYYDIVTLIMDQLITYGPVQSQIRIYKDFSALNTAKDCANIIYKYDGKSEYTGSHGIVIVGYGEANNQYYWIIQNSWGSGFCDKGFAKIEFAQLGIEKVSFSQPYVDDNSSKKEISITITEVNEYCNYIFTSPNSENYFEMFFKNGNSNMYFQCGSNPNPDSGNNNGICSLSQRSLLNEKGTYTFSESGALLNEDEYKLDFTSEALRKFQYYGVDTLELYTNKIYISEEGSKISVIYIPTNEDEKNKYPKIYPNSKTNTPLSTCSIEDFGPFYLIVCTIQSSELSYFSASNNLPLAYDLLCSNKYEMTGKVSRLDKSKYPIFRIKSFYIEDKSYLDKDDGIILLADIEGSVSGLKNDYNIFYIGIKIERSSRFEYNYMGCQIDRPKKIQNDFEIKCNVFDSISFNKIYLGQYYFPDEDQEPFEVIVEKKDFQGIEDKSKFGGDSIKFRNSNSLYNINIYILLLLGLLSL